MNDVVRRLPAAPARRSMADRIRDFRDEGFVGRAEHRRAFAAALRGEPDAARVLLIHGPGGIGKSALLRRLADDAEAAGRSVVRVDGEYVMASTAAFAERAGAVYEVSRPVLLVDGFEHCQVLETWLREDFLMTVPEDTVVVVAARQRPQPHWTLDPGWRHLVRAIALEPLAQEEATALLGERGVPSALHTAVNGFAGGHPLALCLAAETAAKGTPFDDPAWEPGPDVIQTLLARLIDRVPSASHEYGLRVCGRVRHVTMDLLRTGLAEHEAVVVFEWLRGLPYLERGEHGLVAHELVRDVLDASFQWRDPAAYDELHLRLWRHLGERAQATSGNPAAAILELNYLNRYGEQGRKDSSDALDTEELFEREYAPEARDDVLRLAREDQGDECARLVAYWLDRQPEAFSVYCRARDMEPVAFFAWLRLYPETDELTGDPAVAAVGEYLEGTGGTQPGDNVGIARFMVPAPVPDRPTTGTKLRVERISAEIMQRAGLVVTFHVMSGADAMVPKLASFDYRLFRSVPELGEGDWGVFVHDWRAMPQSAYRERPLPVFDPDFRAVTDESTRSSMSKEDFAEAVKQVLGDWHDDDAVDANPLVRVHGDAAALREAVLAAVDALSEDARRIKHQRAVQTTYLERATTQEGAAARLGIPFGTYRRYLRLGLHQVCDILWNRRSAGGG
ncbi:AAA family ATPase [Amycolatopsis minnesotensis]|uniref:AAA family ATPase n=1 Tax=Amycolatopsis minnesotensis TaxID=337894 RepID=UPI0031D3350A